ncbi:MAG TPA: hypothetical protein VF795_11735 [Desulfuromonadaceae bacterium]
MSDKNPVQAVVLTVMRAGYQLNIVRKHDMIVEKHRLRETGSGIETECIEGVDPGDLNDGFCWPLEQLADTAHELLEAIHHQEQERTKEHDQARH